MADAFKYAEVRQKIIDAMKRDLIGPIEGEEEVLAENPRYAYLTGMLDIRRDEAYSSIDDEQEIDTDAAHTASEDFAATDEAFAAADEDEEEEARHEGRFHLPSSIGISFYVKSDLPEISIDVSWGDYLVSQEAYTGKDGMERPRHIYTRIPMKETVRVNLAGFDRASDFRLGCDSNVHVSILRVRLKSGYSLVTASVINKRKNPANSAEGVMFQVEIKAYSEDGAAVFASEAISRASLDADDIYFEPRPIMGRGRGCAAEWDAPVNGRTTSVRSAFIPECELPAVSSGLDGFDELYFSTLAMSAKSKKEETVGKLTTLADSYEAWINKTLAESAKMNDADFREKIGNKAIERCKDALKRIREGVGIISADEAAFDAFCFMNQVIFLQNSIKNYAKKRTEGIECAFQDFTNPKNRANSFAWRPFQIAFILMNIAAIVDPHHPDREVVDLLYFPTGGGKTEAYLGIMAFVIATRRLKAASSKNYNLDGGVTVLLRYTLRLLTTQQRDRITKMVLAAELTRQRFAPKYGSEPISIGFWVGGNVTPNRFDDFIEKANAPHAASAAKNRLYKQLIACPFCGKPLKEENFDIDTERKSVEIFCSDEDCMFYRYKDERSPIPVYLVDEEIYAKCPTIILSTVDKFARLPWDANTNALFGRVDRKCSRDGYVAFGAKHSVHRKTDALPAATLDDVRPFLPPELIIQDELHLITGPLGTIYGAYETIIEEMCTHDGIRPKYIASTATIKNAEAQARCLYAREDTRQFPPDGFEIGDSFFIKEIPIQAKPFRKYVGVCAPGVSMKMALTRIYAIILQTAYNLFLQDEYKDVIDPYFSLVGYFSSLRELGGTVRLLQDDIPSRIYLIKTRDKQEKRRYLNHNVEITSRMSSYKIPEKLKQLETACDSKECLDTAIATNMIAVGMDVDRLGLMVVTDQPKLNSEYIQATSRIGRSFPGLVVTLYNAYRPRDMSHYENFTGYHLQIYRFVEGTSATPFSARARDRVLHALIVAAIRLKFPSMAENSSASAINSLSAEELDEVKGIILDRLKIVKPAARADTEAEIDGFINRWKALARQEKPLCYNVARCEEHNSLMCYYGQPHGDDGVPTLNSMREVESPSNMFYYTGAIGE